VYPPIKRVVIDPYYAEHKEETSEMLKNHQVMIKTPKMRQRMSLMTKSCKKANMFIITDEWYTVQH
ncbi:MAG: hypothetical protein UHZ05_04120, partial [Acutalibacteraceae bacterium]|nr:hypothetical protein [Acutalibacteraceae bacterium]